MEIVHQPRPRPKSKPRTKAGTPVDSVPSTILNTLGSSQSTSQPVVVRDEDDLFIRNRKRTTASWKKLKEIDNSMHSQCNKKHLKHYNSNICDNRDESGGD